MFNAMFAVLIAGSIGYVLSGWAGMAVGATVASVVAVLTETLTPVIEQGTSHERRMRANRHYRARYEALEDSWRRPNPRSRRAWLSAMEPTGKKPAVAGPAPADPMLVAVDEPELPSVPDDSTRGQLPAGSERPGRSARAATSSRTYRRSLVEREVGQQAGASKRRRPASTRGQSSASTARWYSTRVASSRPFRPRVLRGRSRVTGRRLLRMPYRFDRIRRLR